MHGSNQRENIHMQRHPRGKKEDLSFRKKRREVQSRCNRQKHRSNQRHLPNEIYKRRANIFKTDLFKMERRTIKSKNTTTNNNYTIMKKEKTKKIITILIKILRWLYTLISKK